ncbi:hypothetical protein GOODEAATRI_008044, partial [Goodea atripinnis]
MIRRCCPVILLQLLSIFAQTRAITQDILYPYGLGHRDLETPKMDDGSSAEIPLLIPFIFFNVPYRSIYVNNNGVISFSVQMCTTASVEMSTTERPLILNSWKEQHKMSESTSKTCPALQPRGSFWQHGTRLPSTEGAKQPR